MTGSNKRSPQGRVLATLGALALSLIGAVGAASPAVAADYGNVDNTKDGSIIIHKHVQAGSTQSGSADGSPNTITSKAVAGVIFTAYKLTDLDLTTTAGWTGMPTGVPADACDTPSLVGQHLAAGIASPPTDSNGDATIPLTHPAAVGAYLVCETFSPPEVVDKAQPFLVTIPYAYNQSWLYNVHVYPKNGLASITKTVSPQTSLGLGSTSSFPVTTDVPKIDSNATFQYYWVQDAMDSRLTGATVASVVASSGNDLSGYYTVSRSVTNVVSVQFNVAGLNWLSTHGPVKIITTFTGVVGATLGNGMISDTAYLGTKTAGGAVQTPIPSPPADPSTSSKVIASDKVTQSWGDLKLKKVDSGSTSTGLAGAKFQVWAAAAPYAATCSTAIGGTAPITVGTAPDFKTDSVGALTIAGLFVSDTINPTANAGQRCYVLVETEAPAGFVLPVGDLAKTAVAVTPGVTADVTIPNLRYALLGVELPMTGSNGIVALTIAGTVLIAAGLLLAYLGRRRKQTA